MKFEDLDIDVKMEITRLRLRANAGDEIGSQLCEQIGTYIMLGEFYGGLETAINDRLALTEPLIVEFKRRYDVRALQEHTGLSITRASDKNDKVLKICDVQSIKPYVLENELVGRQELDFAALVIAKRELVWREAVWIFATFLAQRMDQILGTIPTVIYGLNEVEKLNIGRTAGGHRSQATQALICDDDPEWLKEFQYHQLTQSQLNDLTKAINAMVSHAEISFSHDESEDLMMTIAHREEKEVRDAVFDYDEYLEKNAMVSPELERIFDEVVQNLKQASEWMILKCFDSVGRLVLETEKLGFEWLYLKEEVLEKGKRWSDLTKHIEKNFPGIKITKAEFVYGIASRNFIFFYELKEDAPDDLKQQHEPENAIRDITETKSMDIAKLFVNRVLYAINSNTDWASKFRESHKMNYAPDGLFTLKLGQFDERLDGRTVDMSGIRNVEWLKTLNQHMLEMTGPDLLIELLGEGCVSNELRIEWTALHT